MQYKVPQNIDMEDKIVGPFTLRQFLYLLFGGLIDYIAYRSLFDTAPLLFWFIFIPVSLVSLGLAIVKVYDRPFDVFIKNAILFSFSPRQRVWQKKGEPRSDVVTAAPAAPNPATPPTAKQLPPAELAKMSQILDTGTRTSPSEGQGQSKINHAATTPENQAGPTGQYPGTPPNR